MTMRTYPLGVFIACDIEIDAARCDSPLYDLATA